MLETQVIGNKEWAEGFFTREDIRLLEDFDCEMRIRYLQQRTGRRKVKIALLIDSQAPRSIDANSLSANIPAIDKESVSPATFQHSRQQTTTHPRVLESVRVSDGFAR